MMSILTLRRSPWVSVLWNLYFPCKIVSYYMYIANGKVTMLHTIWKLTSKFEELWSPARQQLWPWSRPKVKVKVTAWCQWKGLVIRIMHAKYQCSIINTSEDMSKVKVFVTDGRTDGRTDGQMRFNVPMLSRKRGTKTENDYSIALCM